MLSPTWENAFVNGRECPLPLAITSRYLNQCHDERYQEQHGLGGKDNGRPHIARRLVGLALTDTDAAVVIVDVGPRRCQDFNFDIRVLLCDYLSIGRAAIVSQSRTTELHTFYFWCRCHPSAIEQGDSVNSRDSK
jgi:hypothetical protein